MADALAARLSADYLCDDQFERAETLVARLRARHAARQRWSRRDGATFGQEWSAHLPSQPRLQPQRITPAELPHEIAILRHLIANARDG
jgi:hypothetical protein